MVDRFVIADYLTYFIKKGEYDIDDMIHEIADSAVPIYYYDIGQFASHNSHLMTEKAELNGLV